MKTSLYLTLGFLVGSVVPCPGHGDSHELLKEKRHEARRPDGHGYARNLMHKVERNEAPSPDSHVKRFGFDLSGLFDLFGAVGAAPAVVTSSSKISTTSTKTSTTTTKTSTTSTKTSTTSTKASTSSSLTSSASLSSSSSASLSSSISSTSVSASLAASATIKSTILIIARDTDSANQVSSGFNGYGIPFQTLIVPQGGVTLPTLNTSAGGNFGGIVALSSIAYNYGTNGADNWHSALTDAQWSELYAYQITYGVRMTQIDVYPQAAFGTSALSSCCGSGVEQLISFTNTSAFPQAGLRTGAGMSTQGLYHYITQITDSSTTWEIAQFAANSQVSSPSTAAVINNFGGREQMVFFTTWATSWSPTSNYLQHAYITWMTRGLYVGYRRVNLNAQIDDMMLGTIPYDQPTSGSYRLTTDDMNEIRNWLPSINAKMNPGSFFTPEIGYNGNGNLDKVDPLSNIDECSPHPVYTGYNPTTAEFQKPLGTGADQWPVTPTTYGYQTACLVKDPLSVWFQTAANRNSFFHLSHTFTHEALNNATYSDVYKEISFNQQWLAQTGIASGAFSSKGLIPPAITGMHNGDALRAMYELGLRNAVGQNDRPLIRNANNDMWPYITTMASNGFDGFIILPRWPLRIYYDCDTPACTLSEWVQTSAGSGDFNNLMLQEKNDVTRHVFALNREGVMFHQLNLRNQGTSAIATADGTQVRSLYQAWIEQTVQEFTRLCNWPMTSLKQDDLSDVFMNRMARDGCTPTMTWNVADRKITGVTVTSNGNQCSVPIPVTVPGGVTSTQGFTTEQVGNDPMTIWVKMSGSPVTLTLSTPMAL